MEFTCVTGKISYTYASNVIQKCVKSYQIDIPGIIKFENESRNNKHFRYSYTLCSTHAENDIRKTLHMLLSVFNTTVVF